MYCDLIEEKNSSMTLSYVVANVSNLLSLHNSAMNSDEHVLKDAKLEGSFTSDFISEFSFF